jgi:hypothetical protein
MILDTGSNVFILQHEVSRNEIRDSPKTLWSDRGSPGHKRPAASFFHVGETEISPYIYVISLPTEGAGRLGMDFLEKQEPTLASRRGVCHYRRAAGAC